MRRQAGVSTDDLWTGTQTARRGNAAQIDPPSGEPSAHTALFLWALSTQTDARADVAVGALASTSALGRAASQPECRPTRAAMHDYLKGRLRPTKAHDLEAHMDTCAHCIRAFIDVRETSWILRCLSQELIARGHRGGRHRQTRRHLAPTAKEASAR